jgi:hypothetical protein
MFYYVDFRCLALMVGLSTSVEMHGSSKWRGLEGWCSICG